MIVEDVCRIVWLWTIPSVTRLAVVDIVPTYYLYTHVTEGSLTPTSTGFRMCVQRLFRKIPSEQPSKEGRLPRIPCRPNTSASSRILPIFMACAKISRRCLDRSGTRQGGPLEKDRLPAARALGEARRNGQSLRCARDLEGARCERHRERYARRP